MKISTQLIVGIIINMVAFGIMGFHKDKLGIKIPRFLHNEILQIFITIIYFLSFAVILFSPGNLILKIVICLLMQFLINHIIWGAFAGIIAGVFFKNTNKN